MSLWLGHLLAKYVGDRQAASTEKMIAKNRKIRARNPSELVNRVDELEDELARTRLLLYTLTELCVSKGVMTQKELQAMAKKVDLADGVQDGKLAPRKKKSD
jgi:hypothetical protein